MNEEKADIEEIEEKLEQLRGMVPSFIIKELREQLKERDVTKSQLEDIIESTIAAYHNPEEKRIESMQNRIDEFIKRYETEIEEIKEEIEEIKTDIKIIASSRASIDIGDIISTVLKEGDLHG